LAQGPVPTVASILDGQLAGVVLVDAYNLIGEAVEIWGTMVVPGKLPATLKAILPRLQRWATRRSQVEMLVMVDSPHEHSRTLSGNLRLVYSGGQGEHRADQVIKGHLVHLKMIKESRAVVVVSHDAEVRQAAVRHGALVAHPRELAGRVMRMG
jgi:predicted RNA-binding protein with PIN domain